MNNFIIREMVETDLDQVFEIEKNSFQDAWEKEMFLSEIYNHSSRVLIDKKSNKIIGFICGLRIIDEFLINNIAIDIQYRKQGIGEYFLAEVIAEQISDGAINFFLEVRISNISAINLYKKLGFKKLRIRKKYYKNPIEDAYEMGAFYGGN